MSSWTRFISASLLLAAFFSVSSFAQNGAVPRLANGKPDLNGVWDHPYVPDMGKSGPNQKGEELPFTAAGAAKFKAYDPGVYDYTGRCLPQGMTRSMNSPFPIQIVQTPSTTAFLFEAWNVFHVVPTDGRKHPDDLERNWIGLSVEIGRAHV